MENTQTWLPPGVPPDVCEWDIVEIHKHPPAPAKRQFVFAQQAQAYTMGCTGDGKVIEIVHWVDGEQVARWTRPPYTPHTCEPRDGGVWTHTDQ
jgi:hypothetical protein